MDSRDRNGDVGCNSNRPSTDPRSASYRAKACSATSTDRAASSASLAGRNQGTYAPNWRPTCAICGSSVESNMSQISSIPRAASMLQASSGFPANSRRFLPGNLLEPPLAGIRASKRQSRTIGSRPARSNSLQACQRPAMARASDRRPFVRPSREVARTTLACRSVRQRSGSRWRWDRARRSRR